MNTAQSTTDRRPGRPRKEAGEKKRQRSVYLSPEALQVLELYSDNLSEAIELIAVTTGKSPAPNVDKTVARLLSLLRIENSITKRAAHE